MKRFEIRQYYDRFREVESSLQVACSLVPDFLHSRIEYRYLTPTMRSCNMELSLDLLEELTVGNEMEFPVTFWENMVLAAHFLKMTDEEDYYNLMADRMKRSVRKA